MLSKLAPSERVELPTATFVASLPGPLAREFIGSLGQSRTAAIRFRKPNAGSAGKGMVGATGFEPAYHSAYKTPALTSRATPHYWPRRMVSNHALLRFKQALIHLSYSGQYGGPPPTRTEIQQLLRLSALPISPEDRIGSPTKSRTRHAALRRRCWASGPEGIGAAHRNRTYPPDLQDRLRPRRERQCWSPRRDLRPAH